MGRKKVEEAPVQNTEVLDLLVRIKDEIEKVLFNPQGVSATELTDLRDRVAAEIAVLNGEGEADAEHESETGEPDEGGGA